MREVLLSHNSKQNTTMTCHLLTKEQALEQIPELSTETPSDFFLFPINTQSFINPAKTFLSYKKKIPKSPNSRVNITSHVFEEPSGKEVRVSFVAPLIDVEEDFIYFFDKAEKRTLIQFDPSQAASIAADLYRDIVFAKSFDVVSDMDKHLLASLEELPRFSTVQVSLLMKDYQGLAKRFTVLFSSQEKLKILSDTICFPSKSSNGEWGPLEKVESLGSYVANTNSTALMELHRKTSH